MELCRREANGDHIYAQNRLVAMSEQLRSPIREKRSNRGALDAHSAKAKSSGGD